MSKGLQSLLGLLADSRITSSVASSALHIGTHDGSFHCDEVLAISMLKCLPQYADAVIVRTRNPDVLAQCNIVVDVGAKYEPESHRYDHHQKEFNGTLLPNYHTRLSSAGLVYKHFGNDVISNILISNNIPKSDAAHERLCTILYDKVYKGFVEHIDAIDNGVEVAEGPLRYNISTTLSSRVGHLIPAWNQPSSSEALNAAFHKALQMVATEFFSTVDNLVRVWWPARALVEAAIANREAIHPSKRIMVLSSPCPWKDHIFDIEAETVVNGISVPTLYVLFEDTNAGNWRIQAVPENPTSFSSRKKLPWCGLRDDVLSTESGIEGCIFVHASGFIGGNKTREGAMQMAVKALEMQ